ncbi:unnamed protein product [Rotaria sp. Silwood1]|nr:unnamed protein product [Rotaria sp. Silwood1]CAF4800483.1 unnamed protein product [Rotaria sp. Silwood1]CAF4891979.1 unnamed protein product [Rotaria sp. Silwood1]
MQVSEFSRYIKFYETYSTTKFALFDKLKIDLIQIHRLHEDVCPIWILILSNTQNVQAFLNHQDYHYYCLRCFRLTPEYFFKIDSKQPMFYQAIYCRDIIIFLRTLLQCHSNIYVLVQHTLNNIEIRLWPFSDAPDDVEVLGSFHEAE